jgi:hypothetical protein
MMKNRMPTKPMKSRTVILIYLLQLLLFSLQVCAGTTVSSEKDGLVLDVKITSEDGKHLVSCRLTNNSKFPICSASIRYKQVFYVTLMDESGNELPHDEEWANTYAQKSSRIYKRPRSHTGFQVNPGESVDLTFYLGDAYSKTNISQAHQMHVSWESKYFGAENDLDGNPYHFPAEWETSVTLPLAEVGVGASAAKGNEGVVSSGANNSNRSGEENPETTTTKVTSHALWAVFLGILIGLLAVVALKKKSKSITRRRS